MTEDDYQKRVERYKTHYDLCVANELRPKDPIERARIFNQVERGTLAGTERLEVFESHYRTIKGEKDDRT